MADDKGLEEYPNEKESHYENLKQVSLYVNDSHKSRLIKFFDSIKFYRFMIVPAIETSWKQKFRHMNSHTWPGSDCVFLIIIKDTELNWLLGQLKKYRVEQSENILFAVTVMPIELVVTDLLKYDIPQGN